MIRGCKSLAAGLRRSQSEGLILKANSKIKLIALSVSLLASSGSMAALGGLRVNSSLGEPFSATVKVTGKEAKELLKGTKPTFSDGRLKATVRKSGDDALVSLSSAAAIKDPVIVFQMGVKGQSRQYTAVIDPSSAKAKAALAAEKKENAAKQDKAGQEKQDKAEQAKKDKAAKEEAARLEKEALEKKKEAERLAKAARAEQEEDARLEREAKAKAEKERQAQNRQQGKRLYTVQPDETLFIIADKLRPDNMTADQAVRALIKANPKKFGGNPNRLFSGITLTLPASFKSPSEVSSSETADSAADNKPAAAQQPPAPEAETPQTAQEQENTPPQTGDGQAGQDAVEQQPASTEAEAPPPAPSAPKAEQQPAAEEESDGSLWKWLLAGGLGLTIAFLVFKLVREGKLGRKPAPETDGGETPFDEQDGIRLHQPIAKPEHPKAPITKGQADSVQVQDGLDDSDLEDDVVFFDSVDTGAAAADNASFDLDLSTLDIPQAGIASSAVTDDEETRRRQNADWDSIESTESIFEPDEPAPAKPQPAAAKPAAPAHEEEPVSSWATGDAFSLHEKQRAAEKAARPAEPEPVVSWASSAASAESKAAEPSKPVAEPLSATPAAPSPEPEPLSWVQDDIAAAPFQEAAAEPAAQIQTASAAAEAERETLPDFDFMPVAETPAQETGAPAPKETAPVFDDSEAPPAFEPFAATPVEETPAAATQAVSAAEVQTASVETEAPLDFDFEPASPVAEEASAPEVPAPAAKQPEFFQGEEVVEPPLEFTADAFAADIPEAVEEKAASAGTAAVQADAGLPPFDLPAAEEDAAKIELADAFVQEPEAETVVSFGTPAVETPETPAFEIPAVQEEMPQVQTASAAPAGFAEAEPLADPFAAAAQPAPQQPEPAGWQGDDSDVDLTSSVTFDDTQLDTADDLNIDWGSLEAAGEGGDSKPAFVSESVGMTAPLEAKYELAEMYIEIGDPDAARETLYELIDESHGEIQAKSKELLARIGG